MHGISIFLFSNETNDSPITLPDILPVQALLNISHEILMKNLHPQKPARGYDSGELPRRFGFVNQNVKMKIREPPRENLLNR